MARRNISSVGNGAVAELATISLLCNHPADFNTFTQLLTHLLTLMPKYEGYR